jgi:hypothetical protein
MTEFTCSGCSAQGRRGTNTGPFGPCKVAAAGTGNVARCGQQGGGSATDTTRDVEVGRGGGIFVLTYWAGIVTPDEGRGPFRPFMRYCMQLQRVTTQPS